MKRAIVFVATILIVGFSHAQKRTSKHDEKGQNINEMIYKYVNIAKKSFNRQDYANALLYYQKLDSLLPQTPEVYFEMGTCYLHLRNPEKSLPYLEYAAEKNLNYEELYYSLGKSYHYNHMFDKAIDAYQLYLKDLSIDTANVDSAAIKEVKRRIEVCGYAKELIKDTVAVEIENMGGEVNTSFDEYVPIVSADQQVMFFTSRRPNVHNSKLSRDGKHFEDIHMTSKDSIGKWKRAETVHHPVNDAEHDACIGMTADGHTLFLYKLKSNNPEKGNIYICTLKGNTWSKPKKLGSHVNTRRGWEASVSISEDNQKLYFSSDKKGGYGGLDIWYCELLPNNEWSEPKNIGPTINTQYDEDCPFIHYDDKTLFFSSNGHKTMGGFDVFSSVLNPKENAWSSPRNIGHPVNTVDDDMYFVYSADGSKGYMSSAIRKDGMGGEDIYVVHRPNHSKHMISLTGSVIDEETNTPIEATITVTDLENNQIVTVASSNSNTGKYVLALDFGRNYSIQIECANYIFLSENVNVSSPEVIFSERKDFKMKHVKVGNSLVLNNIFFEYNKHTIMNESLPELDKLFEFMKYHPQVYIEISGHTDSIGSDSYNMKLSEERAIEVRNHLVSKGLPRKNMRIRAFGETMPLVSNATEYGRKKNRRTECYIYNIDSLSKEQLAALYKLDKVDDDQLVLQEIVEKNKIGEVLRQKVYFAYNDGLNLSEQSKAMLDRVTEALFRVPSLKLRLQAFTDNVGSERNNKVLYEKRMHTVMDYLQDKGIGAERLLVKPFETNNSLKTLSLQKGNLQNRRVDFVLAGY